MANDIAVIKEQFDVMAPEIRDLLPAEIPVDRFIRTIMVSCEQNKKLLSPNLRNSLFQSAMTSAVLGLECDGVSGQGYLIPYGSRVQFIAGYKGYVTIAARSGRTLQGFLVREGEEFAPDEANGQPNHKRILGGESERAIIAAYAISRGNGPNMMKCQSMDEMLAIRDKSAGFKSGRGPWFTHPDEMFRKCPMRALFKDLPYISAQQASALEDQSDMGRNAWIEPGNVMHADNEVIDGNVIDTTVDATAPDDRSDLAIDPRRLTFILSTGEVHSCANPAQWLAVGKNLVRRCVEGGKLAQFEELNGEIILRHATEWHPKEGSTLVDLIEDAKS